MGVDGSATGKGDAWAVIDAPFGAGVDEVGPGVPPAGETDGCREVRGPRPEKDGFGVVSREKPLVRALEEVPGNCGTAGAAVDSCGCCGRFV